LVSPLHRCFTVFHDSRLPVAMLNSRCRGFSLFGRSLLK
jgi:hypothetical protein